ncbi:MAG: ADP-ribosylglycohydrolase family protein [Myxococcales bacterium]|nr:ADP-ribosylglycohydrolase family protein [Myxococcales bacterium]
MPREADFFSATMLGLAIGDALGFPGEFRSYQQIIESFPPHGVDDLVGIQDPRWPRYPAILGISHPPGTYSDDTQMTIAVAEGLLEAGDTDLDAIMERIAAHFVTWSISPKNDRAPGGTCMTGCAALEDGVPWRQSGVANSKGCGSAMRVAPIGLFFHQDRARLLEVARASSIITHGHDAAIEGAAAAALLVAMALDGASPTEMYDAVMLTCAPHSKDLQRCFEKLPSLLDAPPEIALSSKGLGESWVAEEAVASALYCFWRHPHDFRQAVICAANTHGDSDSIACITGSIAGAALGLEAIPAAWRAQVEDAEFLYALGQQLFERAPK